MASHNNSFMSHEITILNFHPDVSYIRIKFIVFLIIKSIMFTYNMLNIFQSLQRCDRVYLCLNHTPCICTALPDYRLEYEQTWIQCAVDLDHSKLWWRQSADSLSASSRILWPLATTSCIAIWMQKYDSIRFLGFKLIQTIHILKNLNLLLDKFVFTIKLHFTVSQIYCRPFYITI